MVYEDNLEASVAVLRKLSEDWKEHSVKLSPLDPLRETLKNFRNKVVFYYYYCCCCCCYLIILLKH